MEPGVLTAESTKAVEQWTTGWADIVSAAVGLAIVMGIILWVYASMQKPRLYLGYREVDQRPVVTWQAVLRYFVTTTISMWIWLYAILIIMTVAADSRSAQQLAIAAAAVIGAARLLAHISPEASHELGKTIPLAVLTLILLGGSSNVGSIEKLFGEFGANLHVIDSYYFALLAFDVFLTALWTFRQFGKWDTNQVGTFRHRVRTWFRKFARPFRAVRDFGKPVKSSG